MLGVSKQTLSNLITEKSSVSPEMALRLGKFFRNGPDLWMKLQADYDLWVTLDKVRDVIDGIKPPKAKRSA